MKRFLNLTPTTAHVYVALAVVLHHLLGHLQQSNVQVHLIARL
jgi:hypothetical protein